MPENEKLKSEIVRIDLKDATFRGTGAYIEPTYVNFFFGNNGTGKSTIARAISNGYGVSYTSGFGHDDYLTLVFNQDFIDANVRSYHNLEGVFTFNEVNVKIQEQIDEKTDQQADARKKSSDASIELEKRKGTKEELLKQLYKDCWSKTESIRVEFDKTQDGKRKSKQLTEEVRSHSPIEHDLKLLRLMYDAAYADTAKRYPRFSVIADSGILDNIEGRDILSTAIVNAAETDFASFLKEIGATEWFRQGHKDYHDKTNGRCPYCSRKLDVNFEDTITRSFDDRYEKNLRRLDEFLNTYIKQANELFVPLSRIPTEIYPAIDPKIYQDKLTAVKAIIASNIDLIKQKKAEPAKAVVLSDTAGALQELADIITGFNQLIDENNSIVDAGPKKKKECRDKVFEHMAYCLQDVFESYDRSNKALDKEIGAQKAIVDEQDRIINQLQSELGNLRSQTIDTETAIININNMLRDAGFQGFEVRPRKEEVRRFDGSIELVEKNPVINYEVVRTDTGEVATDLSEGEKNFIAFLYFQQKVFGRETAEVDTRKRIVVIDDPVSSMDSGVLFIVGDQIRKMIEICRNNADNRNAVMKGNFIKQIFILTHNAYFHREITYPHAHRYDFVSFYLVKKSNNKSYVNLKEKHNPDCPTEWINVNPVKNSYAALWEEYKELKNITSPIPLMNVIRRILEYYFLQICGYDGSQLRKTILEDKKHEFMHDEAGNEDPTKFDMAKSMLQYIAATTYGVNDGLHYVDDVIDIDQCRETFQMIFHHMGQDQHFNMMMGIK